MRKAAVYLAALLLIIAGVLLLMGPPLRAQSVGKVDPPGIWRGTLEGVPSVTLTLADDTGSLDGTIVFYGLDGETHKVVAMEPHTLIHPTLDGNALTFQVKRLDATLITVKVVFITPTKAELHCLNCGDDAPLAELTKETL
jgi:hypothetical protein